MAFVRVFVWMRVGDLRLKFKKSIFALAKLTFDVRRYSDINTFPSEIDFSLYGDEMKRAKEDTQRDICHLKFRNEKIYKSHVSSKYLVFLPSISSDEIFTQSLW